jgi:cell division protein FtsQ
MRNRLRESPESEPTEVRNKKSLLGGLSFGKSKGAWWIATAAVLIIVFFFAIARKKNGDIQATEIKILDDEASRFLTDTEVRNIVMKRIGYSFEGRAIQNTNLKSIERQLELDPFIEEADVYIDARNKIHLNVKQCSPIVRVLVSDGRSYFLDAKGAFIPAGENDLTARVLVVTGNTGAYSEGYKKTKDHVAHKILQLVKIINENEFWSKGSEQIYVTENQEFVLVPKIGNYLVDLGTLEDLPIKLQRLETFYKNGLTTLGWERYSRLSVKYKNQVVGVM